MTLSMVVPKKEMANA